MKKTILLIFAVGFIGLNTLAQEIKWVTLSEALELQKKTPKKIMMDVYTSWCGPCKMLDKKTFHNADVVDFVNKHYYAVKFDGEGNEDVKYKDNSFSNPNYKPELANRRNSAHELARYLQVNAYPTIVFFDEDAEVIAPIQGYQTPPQLELYLKMFSKNDHENITTQEEFNTYYKAFKAEFKGQSIEREEMKKIVFAILIFFMISESASAQKLNWHTDINEALVEATKEKKALMLFFTGSDWCGWCKKLQSEVFQTSDFENWSENVVLVELDFPKRTAQDDQTKAQNQQLKSMFQVRGYPTVYFVAPVKMEDGRTNLKSLGSTGYVKGGAKKWLDVANNIVVK